MPRKVNMLGLLCMFNVLLHSNLIKVNLVDSNILDLYSGIGSFGIECISRGAKKITFVEKNKPTFEILEKNLSRNGGARDLGDQPAQQFALACSIWHRLAPSACPRRPDWLELVQPKSILGAFREVRAASTIDCRVAFSVEVGALPCMPYLAPAG